ncbi:MAG: Flagellar basal-body rod protein FlgF [Deltaproteobacteria bacterium ADurb.Bin510]|nr:MAG: Flagellar basal-body rod protein FlgF [Deltaproteobacteria bacterium ADurb.Bin510]
MEQGLYTAAAGAKAMEERLAAISANVANISTNGYKKDGVVFEQYLRQLDTGNLAEGEYRRIPTDVVARQAFIDTSQGPIVQTGNPLDLALREDGFFALQTPDGVRYTRNGSFMRSNEGILTSATGYPVLGQGGQINLGQGEVIVGRDGTISVDGQNVDTLQIFAIQPNELVRAGDGLYASAGTATPLAANQVEQGVLEGSNAQAVPEMLNLISTQRSYESLQKVMRSYADINSLSIRNIGAMA